MNLHSSSFRINLKFVSARTAVPTELDSTPEISETKAEPAEANRSADAGSLQTACSAITAPWEVGSRNENPPECGKNKSTPPGIVWCSCKAENNSLRKLIRKIWGSYASKLHSKGHFKEIYCEINTFSHLKIIRKAFDVTEFADQSISESTLVVCCLFLV